MTALNSRRVGRDPAPHDGRIQKRTTKVFIVGDHPLVRRGLAAVIGAEPDLSVCGDSACATGVITALGETGADAILIDVSLTRMGALELIQAVRRIHPRICVVALAMTDMPEMEQRISEAGAATFVMKAALTDRLLAALRRGSSGPAAEASLGERRVGERGARTERRLDAIEREIVEMIGHGIPSHAIAVRLGLSVAMVDAHRRRIRGKLNFPTATQLVEFCVRWAQQRSPAAPPPVRRN